MDKKTIVRLAACFCAVWIFSCGNNDMAGNGTRTGNPTIAGVLYQPDGKTPAGNAQVNLRSKNFLKNTSAKIGLPKRSADSATVTTKADGRFEIDSVDTGAYVIECTDGNNNYALNDSVVVVDEDSTVTLPPDTLKPAGAVKGVIKLSEGGDARRVFILAFGIDRFTCVNADGSFLFGNLPEGRYELRVISVLDYYGIFDTMDIRVKSKDTTALDTIELLFHGIPALKNMHIGYDTLNQIVNLSWDGVGAINDLRNVPGAIRYVDMFDGYNVYRKHLQIDTVFRKITPKPVTDTFYLDSTCRQEETYAYCVSVAKKDSSEGKLSPEMTVRMKSYFSIDTLFRQFADGPRGKREIQHSMVYNGKGLFYLSLREGSRTTVKAFDTNFNYVREFTYIHQSINDSMRAIADIASGNDGSAFIGDFDDSIDRIRSVFIFTANGDFVKRLPVSNAGGNVRGVGIEARLFTVDSRNRIVFVNAGQDSVLICDTSGTVVAQFKGSDNGQEALGFPDGAGKISFITTDRRDNICVVDFQVGIQVFSPLGVLLHRLAINEMNLRVPSGNDMIMSNALEHYAKLSFLNGTAVDPLADRIFALDHAGFFCVFSPDGGLITENVFDRAAEGAPCDMIFVGKKIYIALANGTGFMGTIVKFTNNLP